MRIFLVAFIIFFLASAHGKETAQSLVEKADLHRGLKGPHSMQVKILAYDGSEIQEQIYQVKVRDADDSLVEQISPVKAKGRKLLMKGLDMWIFTPQLKKSVRIGLQQKLTGEVANGDISRTHYAGDYTPTIVGQDKLLKATIIDLKAIDKRATYQSIKYWVSPSSFVPVQAQFFALSGKLMKTAKFSKFKNTHGVSLMTEVTIQDAVMPNKKSVMIYSDQVPEAFNDSLFNKEQMDR